MKEKTLNLPAFGKLPGAVVIDLDGTLLNSQTQLSERNCAALEVCIIWGIPVIIATSRAMRTARHLLGNRLSDKCSLVVMNGAVALGVPPLYGQYRESFPPGVALGVVNLLRSVEPEVKLTIEIDGWELGRNWDSSREELWQYNTATIDMVITLEEALVRGPSKIAASRMGKDVSDLAEVVSQQFGDVVSVLPANGMTFLNIVSIRTSKSEAVRKLLQSCNIVMQDVLAFGDDVPDLDLLEACGIPVAMANCVPEVKATTGYITASNDEDGVAIVLEKMLVDTNTR